MDAYDQAAPSGVAAAVAMHDAYVQISKAFCVEMPDAVLEIVGSEPTGQFAEMYRGYVQYTMLPAVRRVADTMRKHSAYTENCDRELAQQGDLAVE